MNSRMLNNSLNLLVRQGILSSQTGGREPGFIFAINPKLISLYELIKIFEGEPMMKCCKEVISDIKCDVNDCSDCLVYSGINGLISQFSTTLKSISIYDHYLSSLKSPCSNSYEQVME